MAMELVTQVDLSRNINRSLFGSEISLSRINCGPCSTASIINELCNFPLITAEQSRKSVSLGNIVSTLQHYDGTTLDVGSDTLDAPYEWRGITRDGASYFGALRTILEAFGLSSETKSDFLSINDFRQFLSKTNSSRNALLLSVSSGFVNEVTHPHQGTATPELKRSGHIISVLAYDPDSQLYTIFDPMGNGETIAIDAITIDTYVTNHPKGYRQAIAVTSHPEDLSMVSEIPNRFTPVHPKATEDIRLLIRHAQPFNSLY